MTPVIIMTAAVSAIILLGIFFGGRLTGSNERSSTTPVGNNENSENCKVLCNQWDQRRQERCIAENTVEASQRKVDNTRASLAVATIVAGVLAGAAYLASLAPGYGWVVAIVLGAAAVVAFLAADFILGKLSAAGDELDAAEGNASKARNLEAEARTLLVKKCPDQANACLSLPSPC